MRLSSRAARIRYVPSATTKGGSAEQKLNSRHSTIVTKTWWCNEVRERSSHARTAYRIISSKTHSGGLDQSRTRGWVSDIARPRPISNGCPARPSDDMSMSTVCTRLRRAWGSQMSSFARCRRLLERNAFPSPREGISRYVPSRHSQGTR